MKIFVIPTSLVLLKTGENWATQDSRAPIGCFNHLNAALRLNSASTARQSRDMEFTRTQLLQRFDQNAAGTRILFESPAFLSLLEMIKSETDLAKIVVLLSSWPSANWKVSRLLPLSWSPARIIASADAPMKLFEDNSKRVTAANVSIIAPKDR